MLHFFFLGGVCSKIGVCLNLKVIHGHPTSNNLKAEFRAISWQIPPAGGWRIRKRQRRGNTSPILCQNARGNCMIEPMMCDQWCSFLNSMLQKGMCQIIRYVNDIYIYIHELPAVRRSISVVGSWGSVRTARTGLSSIGGTIPLFRVDGTMTDQQRWNRTFVDLISEKPLDFLGANVSNGEAW